MTTTYTQVPPAISKKYEGLRKDSKFKVHPEGFQLFISLFSGWLEGEKVSAQDIARRLEISSTAVLKTKRNVNKELEVDWSMYDLVALDQHFKDLKAVADGMVDTEYKSVTDDKGEITVVELEVSSTKWIASQHRDIYKDALNMMKDLKEETQHAAWEQGGRRYFDSRAYQTYAMFMDKVRQYGRDWLDLFGRLEESAITDAILKRKGILEHTMDFLLDHVGEVITGDMVTLYVDSLADEPVA